MTNLELLNQAREGMTIQEAMAFNSYLISSLLNQVPEITLRHAIEDAKEFIGRTA